MQKFPPGNGIRTRGRSIPVTMRCEVAGVRLVLVPHWVKDLRGFVYINLARWFALQDISPTLIE